MPRRQGRGGGRMFQAHETAKTPRGRQVGIGDLVQGWQAMVKGANCFFP